MSRFLIGLSFGSGLEGVDAAAVRAGGVGLGLTAQVVAALRVAFPPAVRDAVRGGPVHPTDFVRNLADTAVHAARQVLTRAAVSPREAFTVGLLEPARALGTVPWPEVADRLAEQTGLTVVHGFRHRDRAAGGTGQPVTALADTLLFRSATHHRLLIHLGAVGSLLFIPREAKVSAVVGFDAGPGNQLLDALAHHGSRGKEVNDPGGRKAVQGRCLEGLLERWRDHPHLTRTPPKTIHPEAFGRSFLLLAFETARRLGATLPDLLCTATHLAARSLGAAARAWLPSDGPRQVLVSGGGVRNGFLWQLLAQQFPGEELARTESVGVPALARNAAAAALLAALTTDAVAGNLHQLTGASGGRLLGHLTPGDGRNWAKVSAWVADQSRDYPRVNRAA